MSIVYSGDTIMDPSAWCSSVLARAWIRAMNQLRAEFVLGQKLYWLLICSGYRTYRFLPVFWQQFYPHYHQPTPIKVAELMEFLTQKQFGSCYLKNEEIVRFQQPQILRQGLKGIPQQDSKTPILAFWPRKILVICKEMNWFA